MKEKIIERICKLLEVKSIMTLVLVIVACYGFTTKMISAELFAAWVTAVVTYFFTKNTQSS